MINVTSAKLRQTEFSRMTDSSVGERAMRGSVDSLEMRLDRQNMIIQTLLMLLLEKKVIQEEEYREWLHYVDGLDGRVDGKLRPHSGPAECAACGRKNSPGAVRCQYCGKNLDRPVVDPRAKKVQ